MQRATRHRTRRTIHTGLLAGATMIGGFAASSLAVEAPASGQDRQTQPDRGQFEQVRDRSLGTDRSFDIKTMIDRMSGTWNVQVELSPKHLGRMAEGARGEGQRAERNRGEGERADRNRRGMQDRDDDQDPGAAASAEREDASSRMMRLEGFATISSMMGDQMIRERFFTSDPRLMPGASRSDKGAMDRDRMRDADRDRDRDRMREDREVGADRDRDRGGDLGDARPQRIADQPAGANRRERGAAAGSPGEAALVGVAWFDFDPDAQEFSAVFIGNGTDRIRHAVGQLDSAGAKLIMHDTQLTGSKSTDKKNGPVVLEWTGPDTFTVTMYAGGGEGMQSPMRDRDATRGGTGTGTGTGSDRDDEARGARGGRAAGSLSDNSTRGPEGAIQDERHARDRANAAMGEIVYRATYTKASGAEARQLEDRARKLDDPTG